MAATEEERRALDGIAIQMISSLLPRFCSKDLGAKQMIEMAYLTALVAIQERRKTLITLDNEIPECSENTGNSGNDKAIP